MSIQSEIDRLSVAKIGLKSAIENAGISVDVELKIDAYPALVDSISQNISDILDTINGEVI